MKNDFRYCIPCGRICSVIDLGGVDAHTSGLVQTEDDVDLAWCYGEFTYSTPPEIPENWIELVVEPSPEELQLMDLNAQ